jgi:hypothetical protein
MTELAGGVRGSALSPGVYLWVARRSVHQRVPRRSIVAIELAIFFGDPLVEPGFSASG